MPNTPYTVRGADTAPFRLTVNLANAISSGVEKSGSPGSISFDQSIHGQPFFVQGDWDKLEGAGEGKGVAVLLEKGASAEDRKRAEDLIAFAGAARAYFATSLGPAPDVPVRIVAVRRGAGFNDSGTVLIDADTLRLPKIDATALSVAETIGRLWVAVKHRCVAKAAACCVTRWSDFWRHSFSRSSLAAMRSCLSCTGNELRTPRWPNATLRSLARSR